METTTTHLKRCDVIALKGRFDAHRKIARWTWPVWMYVSVTGVVIYLLLYQVFRQS